MKNIMKRTLAILLTVISAIGIMNFAAPLEADAASYSNIVSKVTVDTKSSNFYVVTSNNVAVKKGESDRSTIYCKFNAGTVFYASGTTKNNIKIKMGNETVYIPKRNCKATAASCNVTLAYANKNCVIRSGPYETCAVISSITKGSVVKLVGNRTVTNKHGNNWSIVYLANNKVGYVYSPNITPTSKITLTVTGSTNLLAVGETTQLKYTATPSAVSATWSSSNTNVAYVDISGRVKGVAPGTAQITASVGSLLKVSFSITVCEYAIFPAKMLRITQVPYSGYSHAKQNAIDFSTDGSRIVAPFTGKITYIDKNYGYVVFQSTHKVKYADGRFDYMTIGFMHDDNVEDLYVGKIIKQGVPFYDQGKKDPGGKTNGAHVHMAIWVGHTPGKPYGNGNITAFNALYVVNSFTTSIVNYGNSFKRIP